MLNFRLLLACSAVASTMLLTAGVARAQATPSAAVLAKTVDNRYNHLRSLKARYAERYRGMGMDRTETGTLLLEKPGRMRWSYDEPAGKVFVLDGKSAISYTPGAAQADRIPAKQADDLRSPLRFLLGHAQLSRELDQLTVAPVSNGYVLKGVPRVSTANVQSISLTVNAAGMILAMRITEKDGSTTDFTFSNLVENPPVAADAFQFKPPPGVVIVDGAKPL